MEKQVLEIKSFPEDGEVKWRTGDLPKIAAIDPQGLTLTGNLDTPKVWVEKRQGKPNGIYLLGDLTKEVKQLRQEDTFIMFDLSDPEKAVIVMVSQEHSPQQIGIQGALILNPALKIFDIDSPDRYWTIPEMRKFLRLNRVYFSNPGKYTEVINALDTFSGKLTTELEATNVTKESKASVFTKFEGEVPTGFELEMPIYTGMDPEPFWVDIGVDVSTQSIRLYLMSDKLILLKHQLRQEAVDEQLAFFRDETEFPVIVKGH